MPWMIPAVGKSGPGMSSQRSGIVSSGRSISARQASMTSRRLCGGMLVAIPTAIPVEPLINRLGTLVGRIEGSVSEPS